LVAGLPAIRKLVALYSDHVESCKRRGVSPEVVADSDDDEDYRANPDAPQDVGKKTDDFDADAMFGQFSQVDPGVAQQSRQKTACFSHDGDTFYTWQEIRQYADDYDVNDLKSKLDLVETYGVDLEGIVEELQKAKVDCCTKDAWKSAEFALITVHRAKGLEFDEDVILADDFRPALTKQGILLARTQMYAFHVEETNIIYVASTRAKRRLLLSQTLWRYFNLLKKAARDKDADNDERTASDADTDDPESDSEESDEHKFHMGLQEDEEELEELRLKHDSAWREFEESVLHGSLPVSLDIIPLPLGIGTNMLCLHANMDNNAIKQEAYKALKRFHPDKMWSRLHTEGRISSDQWPPIKEKLTVIIKTAQEVLKHAREAAVYVMRGSRNILIPSFPAA